MAEPGGAASLDARILLALRDRADPADPLGPPWVEQAARDLTALGSGSVLVLFLLLGCAALALGGRPRTGLVALFGIGAGMAASEPLKILFARPRPDLVPHGVPVESASFPSGHAMMSAVTYLTLAALASDGVRRGAGRLAPLLAALALTLVVGLTRVYLGVHWPSDVLAGWVLGALWALGLSILIRNLRTRGSIEGEGAR